MLSSNKSTMASTSETSTTSTPKSDTEIDIPSVMDEELKKLIQDALYVGGVPEEHKLSLTDRGYHTPKFYHSLVRYCRKESKEKTVEFIDNLVYKCSNAIIQYKKSDYHANLTAAIVSFHGGVRKLIDTYKNFPDIKCQLGVALMQLNNYIPENYKKNIPH